MSERLNSGRLNNDFQFIEVGHRDPKKKLLCQRKHELVEIHDLFKPQQAAGQAHRCLGCGNPYCEWEYPVHNFISNWLKPVSEGSILAAAELSHQTNVLPEVCGRVCPQDRSCEGTCILNDDFDMATTSSVRKYITDTALTMDWRPDLPKVRPTDRRVAMIGVGPAGLGCIDALVHNGVTPVMFGHSPEIGGLLAFGIPEFKLEEYVLSRRREVLTGVDIELRLNTETSEDVVIEQLFNEHDIAFMGTGTYTYMEGGFPGEGLPSIYDALDFLITNVNHDLGFEKSAENFVDMKGKHVVILGDGDIAMDCNHTSIRQDAKSVICAYHRDEEDVPGLRKEVKNAKEKGVKFLFNRQSTIAIGEDRMEGMKVVETCLGEPDARGRRSPEPIPGSEGTIPAEAVLIAFGFRLSSAPWFERFKIATDSQGCVVALAQTQLKHQTNSPKTFAGGDMVRGSDLAVTAIFEGRTATEDILDHLDV